MQSLVKCLPVAHRAPLALRATARQPARYLRAMPVLRAQAGGDKPEKSPEEKGLQRAEPAGATMVSPWDSFGGAGFPSFGRMGQMMRAMEEEMNQLSRAFGMPSLGAFDLPAPAVPDFPPAAKALACDVKDLGDSIEVTADVPGMDKEDIKVVVTPDKVLQISGERKHEVEEGKKGEGAWRIERSYGSFVRRFRLPDNVNPEGIQAQVKDGVLKLTVPKTEEVKPKEIEVKLGD